MTSKVIGQGINQPNKKDRIEANKNKRSNDRKQTQRVGQQKTNKKDRPAYNLNEEERMAKNEHEGYDKKISHPNSQNTWYNR